MSGLAPGRPPVQGSPGRQSTPVPCQASIPRIQPPILWPSIAPAHLQSSLPPMLKPAKERKILMLINAENTTFANSAQALNDMSATLGAMDQAYCAQYNSIHTPRQPIWTPTHIKGGWWTSANQMCFEVTSRLARGRLLHCWHKVATPNSPKPYPNLSHYE